MLIFRRIVSVFLFAICASQLSDLPVLLVRDVKGLPANVVPVLFDRFILSSLGVSLLIAVLGFLCWGFKHGRKALGVALGVFLLVWSAHASVFWYKDGYRQKKFESILNEGTWVIAKTSIGTLKIKAGKSTERLYMWKECSFTEDLSELPGRWHGSLGACSTGWRTHWNVCDGIAKITSEEGRRDFPDERIAKSWVEARAQWAEETFDEGGHAYTKDGLVLFWGKAKDNLRLNIDMWQIYIDGAKPRELFGSAAEHKLIKVVT